MKLPSYALPDWPKQNDRVVSGSAGWRSGASTFEQFVKCRVWIMWLATSHTSDGKDAGLFTRDQDWRTELFPFAVFGRTRVFGFWPWEPFLEVLRRSKLYRIGWFCSWKNEWREPFFGLSSHSFSDVSLLGVSPGADDFVTRSAWRQPPHATNQPTTITVESSLTMIRVQQGNGWSCLHMLFLMAKTEWQGCVWLCWLRERARLNDSSNVVIGLCDWPQATQVTERTQGFSPETKLEEQNFSFCRLRTNESFRILTLRAVPWCSPTVKTLLNWMIPLLKKRMKRTILWSFLSLLLRRIHLGVSPGADNFVTRSAWRQPPTRIQPTNNYYCGELPHNDQSTTRQRMKLPSYALPDWPKQNDRVVSGSAGWGSEHVWAIRQMSCLDYVTGHKPHKWRKGRRAFHPRPRLKNRTFSFCRLRTNESFRILTLRAVPWCSPTVKTLLNWLIPLLKKRLKRTILWSFLSLLLRRIPPRSQSRSRRLRHQICLKTAPHATNQPTTITGELPHNNQSTTRQRVKLPSYALHDWPKQNDRVVSGSAGWGSNHVWTIRQMSCLDYVTGHKPHKWRKGRRAFHPRPSLKNRTFPFAVSGRIARTRVFRILTLRAVPWSSPTVKTLLNWLIPLLKKRMKRTILWSFLSLLLRRIARSESVQ